MWGFPNVMWDFPKWGLPSLFSQKGYYSQRYGKTQWLSYPMVKKFEDMFIHNDTIHERDGQTPHDG